MKKLKIYRESDELVLERVNPFNHSTKRYFITERGLIEALEAYPDLTEYELEVDADLWEIVNQLKK